MQVMRFCDQCGGENDDTALTCKFCHQPLTSAQEGKASTNHLVAVADKLTGACSLLMGERLIASGPEMKPGAWIQERYQISAILGEGGYGTTYEARDTHKGRRVAIKMLDFASLSPTETIDALATFNDEMTLLQALDHTGIPHLLEHFSDQKRWFLVIDYVEGRTLESYLATLYPLHFQMSPITNALMYIAVQICDILTYLHNQDPPIIYRDLKPENIIVGARNKATLIDFGIARRYKPGQARDTIPFGSPGYAAPEQYGKAQTTVRSDIYSLGALLHQMLTGEEPAEHPFRFPPIPSSASGPLYTMSNLVASMLELDPEKRPASSLAVKREIEFAFPGCSVAGVEIYSAPQIAVPGRTWGRRAFMVAGGLALLGGVGGFISLAANSAKHLPASSGANGQILTPTQTLSQIQSLTLNADMTLIANWNRAIDGVVVCADKSIRVLAQGKEVFVYKGHAHLPGSVVCLPYSDLVASCEHGSTEVLLWSRRDGKLKGRFNAPAPVQLLAAANNRIALACEDQQAYVFDCTNLALSRKGLSSLAFLGKSVRDIALILDASNKLYLVSADMEGLVNVFLEQKSVLSYRHTQAVNEVGYSPVQLYIASASDDGTVKVRNFYDAQFQFEYRGHANSASKVLHVAWLDDAHVASLDSQGNLHIWSIPASFRPAWIDTPDITETSLPDYKLNPGETSQHGLTLTFARNMRTLSTTIVSYGKS